jgi:hypothetical protein
LVSSRFRCSETITGGAEPSFFPESRILVLLLWNPRLAVGPFWHLEKGGALETILEGETGLFFKEQTPNSLAACIRQFEAMTHAFNPAACRINAGRFNSARFKAEIKSFLQDRFHHLFANYEWPV